MNAEQQKSLNMKRASLVAVLALASLMPTFAQQIKDNEANDTQKSEQKDDKNNIAPEKAVYFKNVKADMRAKRIAKSHSKAVKVHVEKKIQQALLQQANATKK